MSKKKTAAKKKKRPIPLLIGGGVLLLLGGVYLGGAAFFSGHFFPHTAINGQDASLKNEADVTAYFKEHVDGYALTITGQDGTQDTIAGNSISLSYADDHSVQALLKEQNPFLWPLSLFKEDEKTVPVGVRYDEKALSGQIGGLRAVTAEQTPPVSAKPAFDGNQFVVTPEVYGNALAMDVFTKKLTAAITALQPRLDLKAAQCYQKPAHTADAPEVQAACDVLNQYCKASITYQMDVPVVVDKALISTWLTVGEDLSVALNEDAIRQWLTDFGNTYDTLGTTRTFTTPTGKTAQVSGGTYGWSINEITEFDALVSSIRNGEVVEKEPDCYQKGAVHGPQDWGTTYVDVDLSAQHMWYIADGSVVFESDIVTGLPVPAKATPQGVYDILEKIRGKTLTGNIVPSTGKPEYRTYVDYWMRVTYTGIGFHDANWQRAFGGSRYKSYGSHGCINMPVSAAATFFDMIQVDVPVVMHY